MTSRLIKSRLLIICMLLSIVFVQAQFAQGTGKVVGKVTEATSGSALTGANVILLSTTLGASADLSGNYTISRVPAGTYQIKASYLGYEAKIAEITVEAGRTLEVNLALQETATKMEDLVVYGQLTRGQAKSLNEQKTADNIKNVVSSEQFQLFPDRNAAETVMRIPGVSITYDQGEGEMVQIRGIGPEYNSLTVNGQRIPAPDPDAGRSVGLDLLNQDMMENIEVTKALTPDMDGDAIGGNINFELKQAPESGVLAFNIGAGLNNQHSEFTKYGKDIIDLSGYAGRRFFNNKLGVLVAASYYKTNRGSLLRELEYNDVTTGIISAQHSNDYDVLRERTGININTEYKFNEFNKIYLNYNYNKYMDQEIRREVEWIIADEEETKETRNRVEDQHLSTFMFGGKHNFNGIKLDYDFSLMKADEDMPQRTYFRFQRDFDFSNYSNADVKDFGVNTVFSDQEDVLTLNRIRVDDNYKEDEDKSAGVNVEVPYNLFNKENSVKFGGKFLHKKANYTARRLQLKKFANDYTITDSQFGFEDIVVDPNDTDYLGASSYSYEDKSTDNYDASERVIAAYAMTTIHLNNNLSILGGARIENTNNQYKTLATTSLITDESDASYTDVLPSIHFTYRFSDDMNIRLAYSTGIARPDYVDLIPTEFKDSDSREISYGNPDLKPTKSNNLDLLFEKYTTYLGYFSAGLFYKNLSNIITTYTYNETLTNDDGTTSVYEISKPINSDDNGYAYGFELALNHRLNFLGMAFFNDLNVYANYTYTKAEMTVDGRDVPLGYSPEHIMNLALMYDNPKLGLSFVISNNFRGDILESLGDDKYTDSYFESEYHLDISVTQKITDRFSAILQLNNLTDQYEQERYGDPSESYSVEEQCVKYGSYGTLGISFKL